MPRKVLFKILVGLLIASIGGVVVAQRSGRNRAVGGIGSFYDEHDNLFVEGGEPDSHLPPDRNGLPLWFQDPHFKSDVFTFVRIEYTSNGSRGHPWITDFPDSDLNFSFRLQQMTAIKVA